MQEKISEKSQDSSLHVETTLFDIGPDGVQAAISTVVGAKRQSPALCTDRTKDMRLDDTYKGIFA